MASEESGVPENAQSQASATATDAGPAFGKTQPGSGAFPCLSETAAYYSDAGPPPPTGGCRDLYSRTQRHPPGCVITIVSPTSPNAGSCAMRQCLCGEDGRWQPSDTLACAW